MTRILIPVDFTSCSLSACNFGSTLAHQMKAEVYLFHAYEGISDAEVEESRNRAEKNIEDILQKLSSNISLENSAEIRVHKILRHGSALEGISDVAKEIEPDLILISTSSIGDKVKKVLGSRSYKIIRSVEIPVLSLPDEFGNEAVFPLKIGFIAGNDALALKSFKSLLTLSSFLASEIHLIELCPFGTPDCDSKLNIEIKQLVESMESPVKLINHVIDSIPVIESIDQLIEREGFDMISVATQNKKFLSRLLFPGIMKHLYFNFEIPMLILHS